MNLYDHNQFYLDKYRPTLVTFIESTRHQSEYNLILSHHYFYLVCKIKQQFFSLNENLLDWTSLG